MEYFSWLIIYDTITSFATVITLYYSIIQKVV